MSRNRKVEEQYKRVSQLEHILLRPDTYIGSIELSNETVFVYNPSTKRIEQQKIEINWGLYKLFDEILVNAADNYQRSKTMSFINVRVNAKKGEIVIENDGKGIPITKHKKEKIYVPEMLFGVLLTGSNFDDNEGKTTGGRNGYGCKLANIFSRRFEVEVQDGGKGKRYRQVWERNMRDRGEPEITKFEKTNKSMGGSDDSEVTDTLARKSSKSSNFLFFRGLSQKFRNMVRISCVLTKIGDLEEQRLTSHKHIKTTKIPLQNPESNKRKAKFDMIRLMWKRTLDIQAITGSDVRVTFNGKHIPIKTFKAFMKLHFPKAGPGQGPAMLFENCSKSFQIGIALNESQKEKFRQVSLVNGINTLKGGSHVRCVTEQVATFMADKLSRKHKVKDLKEFQIKHHLTLFVNCLVSNPTFTSQTKESLSMVKSKISLVLKVSQGFLKRLYASPLTERLVEWSQFKQNQMMNKALTAGRKMKGIRKLRIKKLEDANMAGGPESHRCTLILTEGDSAKSLAMAGMGQVGRDYWGVFPLRGKLLNVRGCNPKTLTKNLEIQNVVKILGLQMGLDYSRDTAIKKLRYGRLMIMADQDADGSHIKGLVLNFIHCFWPSLAKRRYFLCQFITPIVKVMLKARSTAGRKRLEVPSPPLDDPYNHPFRKQDKEKKKRASRNDKFFQILVNGQEQLVFFSQNDYISWYKEASNKEKVKKVKYYKGLGTSTDTDARRYFKEISRHTIPFEYRNEKCGTALTMAFDKKLAYKRKEWLQDYDPERTLNFTQLKKVSLKQFVDLELIHFSMSSLKRAIPNLMDGLKPGKRKILFSCFKRNLTGEIKVAQLTGYVAEHSAYHHGEQSLSQTIIGMAQDFLGSNNVNLLMPIGQFGSRYDGTQEAASPRYIFTTLSQMTRMLFRKEDDGILEFLEDDGQMIEPLYYAPIIPMVLINGAEGIGTGWSTSVPKFDPLEIIDSIMGRIKGTGFRNLLPYCRHFTGTISEEEVEVKATATKSKKDSQKSKLKNSKTGFEGNQKTGTQTLYCFVGRLVKTNSRTLDIYEIPPSKKIRKYKEYLQQLMEQGELEIQDIQEFHTRRTVHFRLLFKKNSLRKLNLSHEDWIKKLKLSTKVQMTNMMLFDPQNRLREFKEVSEILEEFFQTRAELYVKRRQAVMEKLLGDFRELSAKAAFLRLVGRGELNLSRMAKKELIEAVCSEGVLDRWEIECGLAGGSKQRGQSKDRRKSSSSREQSSKRRRKTSTSPINEEESGNDGQRNKRLSHGKTKSRRATALIEMGRITTEDKELVNKLKSSQWTDSQIEKILFEMSISKLTREERKKTENKRNQKLEEFARLRKKDWKILWRENLEEFKGVYVHNMEQVAREIDFEVGYSKVERACYVKTFKERLEKVKSGRYGRKKRKKKEPKTLEKLLKVKEKSLDEDGHESIEERKSKSPKSRYSNRESESLEIENKHENETENEKQSLKKMKKLGKSKKTRKIAKLRNVRNKKVKKKPERQKKIQKKSQNKPQKLLKKRKRFGEEDEMSDLSESLVDSNFEDFSESEMEGSYSVYSDTGSEQPQRRKRKKRKTKVKKKEKNGLMRNLKKSFSKIKKMELGKNNLKSVENSREFDRKKPKKKGKRLKRISKFKASKSISRSKEFESEISEDERYENPKSQNKPTKLSKKNRSNHQKSNSGNSEESLESVRTGTKRKMNSRSLSRQNSKPKRQAKKSRKKTRKRLKRIKRENKMNSVSSYEKITPESSKSDHKKISSPNQNSGHENKSKESESQESRKQIQKVDRSLTSLIQTDTDFDIASESNKNREFSSEIEKFHENDDSDLKPKYPIKLGEEFNIENKINEKTLEKNDLRTLNQNGSVSENDFDQNTEKKLDTSEANSANRDADRTAGITSRASKEDSKKNHQQATQMVSQYPNTLSQSPQTKDFSKDIKTPQNKKNKENCVDDKGSNSKTTQNDKKQPPLNLEMLRKFRTENQYISPTSHKNSKYLAKEKDDRLVPDSMKVNVEFDPENSEIFEEEKGSKPMRKNSDKAKLKKNQNPGKSEETKSNQDKTANSNDLIEKSKDLKEDSQKEISEKTKSDIQNESWKAEYLKSLGKKNSEKSKNTEKNLNLGQNEESVKEQFNKKTKEEKNFKISETNQGPRKQIVDSENESN